MDTLKLIESLGIPIPSPAYLAGSFLFGIIGLLAYRYGKQRSLVRCKWIGVVLMVFPYGVAVTWMLYVVGALLCAAVAAEVYSQRTKERLVEEGHGKAPTPSA